MPRPVVGASVRLPSGLHCSIREVLYVRPDELAAAVYLNDDFTMTEIAWRQPAKGNPEEWCLAKRADARKS